MSRKKSEQSLSVVGNSVDTPQGFVSVFQKEIQKILAICERPLCNDEDMKAAVKLLADVKEKISMLEEKRKSFTKPLDVSKREIMNFFSKPLLTLEEIKKNLSERILEYQRLREQMVLAESEEALAIAKKNFEKVKVMFEKRIMDAELMGEFEIANELREELAKLKVELPKTKELRIEGFSVAKIWKFIVEDESLVPAEYKKLVIDEEKLQQIASATKGTLNISGVKFYCEEVIRQSTKEEGGDINELPGHK